VSNSYSGVLVTFDKSLHEDDVAVLMQAIRQMRNVIGVAPAPSDHFELAMAKVQVRCDLLPKVLELIRRETA